MIRSGRGRGTDIGQLLARKESARYLCCQRSVNPNVAEIRGWRGAEVRRDVAPPAWLCSGPQTQQYQQ